MRFSDECDQIVKALIAATSTMDDMVKTQTAKIPTKAGGSYQYTYVDLAEVMGHVRPILAANGIAVAQETLTAEGGTSVSTTLLHVSGQWMSTAPLKLPSATDAQSHGSAITYARRYSLMAILGLATEDDDGLAASPSRRPSQRDGETVPDTSSPGDGSPVAEAFDKLNSKQKVSVQKRAKDEHQIMNVRAPEHEAVVLALIKEELDHGKSDPR